MLQRFRPFDLNKSCSDRLNRQRCCFEFWDLLTKSFKVIDTCILIGLLLTSVKDCFHLRCFVKKIELSIKVWL